MILCVHSTIPYSARRPRRCVMSCGPLCALLPRRGVSAARVLLTAGRAMSSTPPPSPPPPSVDWEKFREDGKAMVDFIADYFMTMDARRVAPDVSPGGPFAPAPARRVASEPPPHREHGRRQERHTVTSNCTLQRHAVVVRRNTHGNAVPDFANST